MKELTYLEWLKEGAQYQKAVTPGSMKVKFTPTIAYNILSMSLESYCMAIMDKHQNLPDNHTFYDLVDGLERVIALDPVLKDRILDLGKYQEICSIKEFQIAQPDEQAIVEFHEVLKDVAALAEQQCNN